MTKTAELLGHTERVLNTCLSPDTSTLLSAGADETLRSVGVVVGRGLVEAPVVNVITLIDCLVIARGIEESPVESDSLRVLCERGI